VNNKVVNRVFWGLLKVHSDDEPTFAKFDSPIADE
jgi:hypothetical protein